MLGFPTPPTSCDLLDFFPVWLDLKGALDAFPAQSGVTFRFRSSGLRFVYTALTKNEAGKYLREECAVCGPAFNQNAHGAPTFAPAEGSGSQVVELSEAFLSLIKADGDKGVLLVECSSPLASLELEIVDPYGDPIASRRLHLVVSGVEDMYSWVNLRSSGGRVTSVGEPANAPNFDSNGKNVFFLHGFDVDADTARAWNAEMFKRLWWSGSKARFWGMTWEGDAGSSLNYQANAANAFAVTSNFCAWVGGVTGEKIVLAHSLGNMVVSAAIQDYGLSVSKYFMLNAAVAAECYDSSVFNDAADGNHMLHDEWAGYGSNTWCSTWHRLFSAPDGRAGLTWKDRFPNVLPVAYNYYSSGDEIFEIWNAMPTAFSGGIFHLERYAWQKQELFKGRGIPGGTTWAGWGFLRTAPESTYEESILYPDAAAANSVPVTNIVESPVFRKNPPEMFTNSVPSATVNALLAKGLPALSAAAGITDFGTEVMSDWDMNTMGKPDGGVWGRSTSQTYEDRWLHSDLKDMAYFYVYKLFDRIVNEGGLE
ncbi:MAG: hypothetical protein PHV28_05770 [Kiritimatiellae bacterium]|nr:hypothetical protein [Kiritimatiellia bacterium]